MGHRYTIFPFGRVGTLLKLTPDVRMQAAKKIILLCAFLLMSVPFLIPATAQTRNAASLDGKDDEEQAADKAEFKRWIKYYTRSAEAYEFRLADEPNAKLTVSPTSLMTYAFPSGGIPNHGAFFVWTRLGRPELIGSMWSSGRKDQLRKVSHEFHSLSTGRLKPVQVGTLTWSPKTGIELKPIPDAAPPKKSAALRLAQMRSLSREFKGFATHRTNGNELELRTLPQPLYRYESKNPDVLDGAVFGMFRGWDPDIILLVEARKTKDGFEWVYGYGRFNTCLLRLEHKGVEVWKEGRVPLSNPRSNFFAVRVANLIEPPVEAE